MSRHHPYSGYDEGSHHYNGHRKHSRGGGRGGYVAHARDMGRRGSVSGGGGGARMGWESLGSDTSFEHGPSRTSEREMPNGPRHVHKGPKTGMKAKIRGDHHRKLDSVERELSIDERIQRERPCRTLFVRNVKYETNSQEVRQKFEQMGEIKTFFDLIGTRGMVFITYYDIRAATMAKERLQASDVCGRPIDVHYSLPKDNELERRCDRDKNQATLFLAITDANRPFDDDELMAKFSIYGEVRSIKHFKDSPYQRFVEYWDSRACERAHDDLVGSSYLGGKLDLKFSWDTGMVPKARLSMQLDSPRAPDGHHSDGLRASGSGIGANGSEKHAEKAGYDHPDQHLPCDSHYQQPCANYGDPGGRRERPLYDRNNSYGSFQNGHHDSYRQSGQGHLSSQSQAPPLMPNQFGGEIDERRLDQAHKVQELLASLTKAGSLPSVGGSPSLGAGHSPFPSFDSLGNTCAPAMAQSRSAPHALYGLSSIQPGPSANAFGPVYPSYPELVQAGSGAEGNFASLAGIMGQLSGLPSAPTGQYQANSGVAYLPTFERQSPRLGTAEASGSTLPASVLALLQKSQYGSSAAAAQQQQQTYQSTTGGTSVGVVNAIPTAPRAMQSTNPNFIVPNGATAGRANEVPPETGAGANQMDVIGAQYGNGAHLYQHLHPNAQPVGRGGGTAGPAGLLRGVTTGTAGDPAAGTAGSQAAAVQQLLQALLQQQQQQQN